MSRAGRTTATVLGLVVAVGVLVAPAATAAGAGVCSGVAGCHVVARVDVNGDGRPDVVGLARRGRDGTARGAVVLRVETGPGRIVATRRPTTYWSGALWQGAARLDSRPGRELVVGQGGGAAARFYQSVTWRHGALVPFGAPGPDRTWAVGRSATTVGGWQRQAADPPGTIRHRVAARAGSAADSPFRGVVTTYRWRVGGWHQVARRVVQPLSEQQARAWGGFHVPGLARW